VKEENTVVTAKSMAERLTIDWGEAEKAPDERKRWLASWLISRDGEEGDYFYDGPGGQETIHDVPAEAVGFRLRWWPSGNTVELNLEMGPVATLADDYLFPEKPERAVKVAALDLVR
jgi:hypothetical protein